MLRICAASVWYGQLPEAATAMKRKRTPNEVIPMATDPTVVLTSQRYRESAQPRSSISGSDFNTWSKYQLKLPSSLRCRFWLRSMADPRMSTEEDLSKLRGWKDVLSISESTAARTAVKKQWYLLTFLA